MAFVIVFAVCFFPQHVFMLWFYIHPTAQQDYNVFWHYFRILGFCLAFTNSCINPIALYCVSSTFRKYFDRYFSTKKRKKNTHTHIHFLDFLDLSYSEWKSCLVRTNRKSISIFKYSQLEISGENFDSNLTPTEWSYLKNESYQKLLSIRVKIARLTHNQCSSRVYSVTRITSPWISRAFSRFRNENHFREKIRTNSAVAMNIYCLPGIEFEI